MKRTPPHREGMEQAQAALTAADRDLKTVRARWPTIHALTGKATRVGAAARDQKVTNHLGDLFDTALREG